MKIAEGLVKVSVRELVEFVMRQGSIRNNVVSSNRAVIGTLAHKKIQNSMEPNYEAEVKMVHECRKEEIVFVVEGRADGVIKDLVSVTIDEIKTTATPLEAIDEDFNPLHWAQAKCYAYFYAKDHDLSEMQVRLTYYNIETKEIKNLQKAFSFEELESFFNGLIEKYYKWMRFYMEWTKERDASLLRLSFPFETYRKGQREVAVSVYKAIKNEKNLFINAPTGIGKTISTLFPALKAMGEGAGSKIFYLTAKTITRTVAEEGILRLYKKGARLKAVTLTAKDKICFCEKRQCHPDFCQWADGHYDRVDEAVFEMINKEDLLTRTIVEEYARKYQVCPFELSLDLANWADVIICDYNYVFDPAVGLKRFTDNSDFILLIDEAHNLVDRAREMYSAGLSKKQVLAVKKLLGKKESAITKELTKINDCLLDIRKDYIDELGVYISKEAPKNLYTHLRRFLNACDKKLVQKGNELPNELLDLYFEVYSFNRCFELFDEHYIAYAEQEGSEVYFKLFCLDPSLAIEEITSCCKSAVFFSATLLPIDYFKEMLGGREEIAINFESPFNEHHALRMIASSVSTRYKDREKSLKQISGYIKSMIKKKKGHYMIFFPSYKYMTDMYNCFIDEATEEYKSSKGMDTEKLARSLNSDHQKSEELAEKEHVRPGEKLTAEEAEGLTFMKKQRAEEMLGFNLYQQTGQMSEEEREAFLRHFEDAEEASLNFCVLGGIFSEGIDLTGERLIGVIIVGVGIPQIGLERDLIKAYFDETRKDGYHYAYTYPGINKVLQAVGRLIRTEEDRGAVLLIDDRYNTAFYQSLLPHTYEKINSPKELSVRLKEFWTK